MRLSSLSTSRSPAGLRLSEHCDIVAGLQEQVDSLASEIFVKLEPQAGRSSGTSTNLSRLISAP
jgi:hypothetical protein